MIAALSSFLQYSAYITPALPVFAPSPLFSLPPHLVLQSLLSRRWTPLLRPCPRSVFATPHRARPRVEIYHFNAARSSQHWTMPAFTPKQKRQSSACECFVLLPPTFLCGIANQLTGVHDPRIQKSSRSHALLVQLNVQRECQNIAC